MIINSLNLTPSIKAQSALILSSFESFTGQSLINSSLTLDEQCIALLNAPFCVLSHGTQADPIFNYGNKSALTLFELGWADFTALPSRYSAEPQNRDERKSLLDQVSQHGYINNYRGVRISSTGRRFLIEDSIVLNLVDQENNKCGQAAVLYHWTEL